MKFTNTIILSIVILLLSFSTSFGGDRAVNGMIIGGGSGALIGQAIGHNSESTIMGAAVGGILGFIIGSNTQPPVHNGYNPPPIRPYNRYHRPHHHPRIVRKKHRNHPRPGVIRRETVPYVR